MARIKMHILKVKLPFYPPYEVKCRLQNGVSTHPSSRIISNEQSDDDRIIMWVVNLFSVLIRECNGLLICPPRPWWSSRELDVLYHLQLCLP